MADDAPALAPTLAPPDRSLALQRYQIFSQTILGIVGIAGYAVVLALVIGRQTPWSSFQENQIASALGFLAGSIVGGIFSFAFGSSFSSMAKNVPPRA